MSRRIASLLLVIPLASALAACASARSAPAAAPSAPTTSPAATLPAVGATQAPDPTASADIGSVGGPGTPDFSVEPVGAQAIKVTLVAAEAKAWRISVVGAGDLAAHRWDLTIETGDVGPAITTTEITGGVAGEPKEQPRLELGDAAGKVCSAKLPVCLVASSLQLPANDNGTVVVELVRADAGVPLSVTAATATWAGDPFNLGPWTVTEAFAWGA